MTREELVRLAVLMNIADHYEEPVHVYECVAEALSLCELLIVPEETQGALVELTNSGLAKAYRLSAREPFAEELQGVPPFDGSHDYYFWITEEGIRSLAMWRKDWPFDGEGELTPGWVGLSD